MRPSAFQLSRYPAVHIIVDLTHLFLPWASVGSLSILKLGLLTRELMIDLLEVLVAIAGFFDLLLLLTLNPIFSVWAIQPSWVCALVSAKAQTHSRDSRNFRCKTICKLICCWAIFKMRALADLKIDIRGPKLAWVDYKTR